VAAQVGGVDPILCVNKIDLADTPPEALDIYRGLGVPVVLTSCETGEGIEALRDALRGKVAVFAGHSGVGKSTLLNALDPNLEVLTQPVGESTDRGKHTTTAARLYKLAGNIHVVDTPGIRSLGLWKVAPHELTWYFPDIAEAAQNCKFNDCTHLHEPDCAVRAAVENGGLPESRYASYVRIFESLSADDNITPGRLASSWQHGTRTDGG